MSATSRPGATIRAALAVIGTSLVLVMAGATPAMAAETWGLNVAPTAETSTTVRAGTPITVLARASGCTPGQATLWWSDAMTLRWRPAQQVRVDATCQISLTIPAGLATTEHRFAVTRDHRPPTAGASILPVRAVPRITIDLPATIGLGATPQATVEVSRHSSGRMVEIQGSTSSGTVMVHRQRVGDSGRLSFPFVLGRGTAGVSRLRVVVDLGSGRSHASGWVAYTRAAPQINARIRATTSADVARTYRPGCPVGPSGLSTIEMNYWGYDGRLLRGSLIVRRDLAQKVLAAFTEAFNRFWPIQNMASPNLYAGNDLSMMAAGLTSAFNCRTVVGNPYAQSPHSYGTAVDINPRENPYRDPSGRWHPNATYATYRPTSVTGLMGEKSAMVVAMRRQGFTWYKGWDWHHFQF